MKQTAIYVRVSTLAQNEAGQLAELRCFEASHNLSASWFTDKFTGSSMQRPAMDKLLAALRRGEVDCLVVWRLDRLGRTAAGLTALFAELLQLGVRLVSLRDGLDLGTPAGRLMAHVLASVAAYETEIRAERVAAGQAAARAAGKKWGGSQKGWHWKVSPEQIEAVNDLHVQGRTIAHIARATGLSRPTVYRLLRSSEEHIA